MTNPQTNKNITTLTTVINPLKTIYTVLSFNTIMQIEAISPNSRYTFRPLIKK